jgi:hypothetical protein
MALTALEIKNYKSFGHTQKIDIWPITVLLGKTMQERARSPGYHYYWRLASKQTCRSH